MSECGYYKTRSFIPSIWRWICMTPAVWFIRENRQTAHRRAYKCCLVACFTLPLISQIRLRLSTIQLSELFIYKCMHTCQQRPWPWVCPKKKIGRHWKNGLGRPSRSRGIRGESQLFQCVTRADFHCTSGVFNCLNHHNLKEHVLRFLCLIRQTMAKPCSMPYYRDIK